MNNENLEQRKKDLKYSGFERLIGAFESAVKQGLTKFELAQQNKFTVLQADPKSPPQHDHMEFRLKFNKSQKDDNYFWNSTVLTLYRANEPMPRIREFDTRHDHGVTAMEAYRLLSGLSVPKLVIPKAERERDDWKETKPERVQIWLKLDLSVKDAYGNYPLKTMYPQYGFDPKAAVEKYADKIIGLAKPEEREEKLKELSKGLLLQDTLLIGGRKQPITYGLNAEIKDLDIYDKNREYIPKKTIFPELENAKENKANGKGADERSQSAWEPNQVEETVSNSRSR